MCRLSLVFSLFALAALAAFAQPAQDQPASAPSAQKQPVKEQPATEQPAKQQQAQEKQVKEQPAEGPPAEKPPESPPRESTPIDEAVRGYVAAFNANDAAAVAARWSPQGIYANNSTGERTTGREAVQRDLQSLFEESPGVRLTCRIDSVRMIKPDVAAADGQALVAYPTGQAIPTAFSALFIHDGNEWLVDTIHEAELPTPETPYDALVELDWMVGHWVDQTEAARVDTVVRWSPSQSFLLRSYSVHLEDRDPMEGTQVIGWDPAQKQIRSWTFNSDGSFGEGTWSRNGGDWLIRTAQTLADGRIASATQVITRVDDNTITVQTLGRTIDGEPTPATDPVTVVRMESEPEQEADSAAERPQPDATPKTPAASKGQPAPADDAAPRKKQGAKQ